MSSRQDTERKFDHMCSLKYLSCNTKVFIISSKFKEQQFSCSLFLGQFSCDFFELLLFEEFFISCMKYQCNFDQRAKAFKIKDLSKLWTFNFLWLFFRCNCLHSNQILLNWYSKLFVKSLPNDYLTIVCSLDNGMKLYLKSYSLIIQLVL